MDVLVASARIPIQTLAPLSLSPMCAKNVAQRLILTVTLLTCIEGCAKTTLQGKLSNRKFVARAAFAQPDSSSGEVGVYVTEYERDVLSDKLFDVGDCFLWVFIPSASEATYAAHGKSTKAKVARMVVKPNGDHDWSYGDGTVKVLDTSKSKLHLQVHAQFDEQDEVGGLIVAAIIE